MTDNPVKPEPIDDGRLEELTRLITARMTEDITADQLARLEYLVLNDPVARRIYVQFVHQTALLHQRAVAEETTKTTSTKKSRDLEALKESLLAQRIGTFGEDGKSVIESLIPVAQRIAPDGDSYTMDKVGGTRDRATISRKQFSLAAVITVGMVGVLAWLLMPGTPPPLTQPVATLTETHHATWEDKDGRLIFIRDGKTLPPQTLYLADGLAKLTFNDGAVVLLDARQRLTRFEITSPRKAFLHIGKLTARAESESAKGFTVALPGNARVIDVSTEFGVVVHESGRSEVHVLDGEVETQRVDDEGEVVERRSVTKDEAITIEQNDQGPFFEDLQFELERFIRATPEKSFAQVTAKREADSKQRSDELQDDLVKSNDLIAFFPIDPDRDADQQILNQAGGTTGRLNGKLFGYGQSPTWATDRFGRKNALRMDSSLKQHFRIDEFASAAPVNGITISMWVNLYQEQHWNLLATQWRFKGPSFLHLAVERGRLTLHLAPNGIENATPAIVGGSLAPGDRWTHIATTVDVTGQAHLYRNGRLEGSGKVVFPGGKFPDGIRQPLFFGTKEAVDTMFDGAMDDVAVFKRALSEQEILNHYRKSRAD